MSLDASSKQWSCHANSTVERVVSLGVECAHRVCIMGPGANFRLFLGSYLFCEGNGLPLGYQFKAYGEKDYTAVC